MSGSSFLEAGIASNSGSPESKAGDINVNATGSVSLTEFSRISNNTSGIGDAGLIKINAGDTITIDGRLPVFDDFTAKVRPKDIYSGISTTVRPEGNGNAGEVEINTKNLFITNGGQIVADTFGEGSAGTIEINANDTISVAGDGNGSFIGITSIVSLEEEKKDSDGNEIEIPSKRNAGNIEISTKNLFLTNVAQVTTSSLGTGNSGTVKINANETIGIDGNNNKEAIYSGITSIGAGGKPGNAGVVDITTKNLDLTNGGQIGAGNFNQGDGGTVKINASNNISLDGRVTDSLEDGSARSVPTSISSGIGPGIKGNAGVVDITTKNLSVTNGAQVGAVIQGEGNGGSVKINASDTLSIDGRVDGLSLTGEKQSFPSSIATEIEPTGEGKGGNIEITAKNLSITSGGKISSSNVGGGIIGGNITLNVADTIRLRSGGAITAQARENASGGNITINIPEGFVIASPQQNNDILAIADRAKGGDIKINANRVYGFAKENIQSLANNQALLNNGENDINSTSGNPQLSGTLNINTEQLDPAKEKAKTSENLVQPDETVAQACDAKGSGAIGNSFTITGRGGMPDNPTKPLNSIVIAGNSKAEVQRSRGAEEKKTFSSDEIIPARGVAVNEKGQVVLTRYPTQYASDRPLVKSDYCSTSLKQQKLLATSIKSDEDVLDDLVIEEIMNLLYSQGLGK